MTKKWSALASLFLLTAVSSGCYHCYGTCQSPGGQTASVEGDVQAGSNSEAVSKFASLTSQCPFVGATMIGVSCYPNE